MYLGNQRKDQNSKYDKRPIVKQEQNTEGLETPEATSCTLVESRLSELIGMLTYEQQLYARSEIESILSNKFKNVNGPKVR